MSVTFLNKGNNKITELRDTRLHLGLMGDLKKCGGDCYLKKKIDLLMQKNPPRDGQQFYQFQQNGQSPLIWNQWT